jgi:hypothetical protein
MQADLPARSGDAAQVSQRRFHTITQGAVAPYRQGMQRREPVQERRCAFSNQRKTGREAARRWAGGHRTASSSGVVMTIENGEEPA